MPFAPQANRASYALDAMAKAAEGLRADSQPRRRVGKWANQFYASGQRGSLPCDPGQRRRAPARRSPCWALPKSASRNERSS